MGDETRNEARTTWITVGAAWGFLGVALGAFGAHGLEKVAVGEEALAWWGTAVDYHLAHALALVLAGVVEVVLARRASAGAALLAGSLVFSGTLYAMALGGPRWLGAVTPLGGVALLVGWVLLAVQSARSSDRSAGTR